MERAIPLDLHEIERRLLAALQRHGGDGRAITLQSLGASVSAQANAKEVKLALKGLIDRGLVRRAGEDPIPGSPIAFRLAAPVMRGGVGKTEDQFSLSGAHLSAVEQTKPPRRHRSSMPAC